MQKIDCSVLILAGGLATRLRPLTEKIPKALIEVNGEPFIAHQLRLLQKQGIEQVVICIGYHGEQIIDFVEDGRQFGLSVDYSSDGDKLLDTAGCIKQALPLVSENFFVLYGDSYLSCDYARVQAAFLHQKKLGLMTVFRNEGKWDKSNIEYRSGKILAYDKKMQTPDMHYIDYGLGMLTKQSFENVPENQVFDLAALYQILLKQDQLGAYEVTERFYEAGSLAGIKELEALLEQQKI